MQCKPCSQLAISQHATDQITGFIPGGLADCPPTLPVTYLGMMNRCLRPRVRNIVYTCHAAHHVVPMSDSSTREGADKLSCYLQEEGIRTQSGKPTLLSEASSWTT
jgi:hypothetical protein